MKGSTQKPYIYEDYYSNDKLCNAIYKMYKYENRKERCLKGREWMMSNGFKTEDMINSFVENLNEIDKVWEPINNKRLARV